MSYLELFEKNGFETFESGLSECCLKHPDLINPADMRVKLSEILSCAGFENYRLKEVYFYKGSKKPHRTDATGYVEFEPDEEFVHKKKVTFKEKEKV